jgi:hypothetical protein
VESIEGGGPSQRIGLSPETLDFGTASVGESVGMSVRVSNFGFSLLTVTDVVSTMPSVISSSGGGFGVVPFGFVELPLVFRPTDSGEYSGEVIVQSDDPLRPELRIPLSGRGINKGTD